MPSSLHAQMTRSAISPRFATRIFLNIRVFFEFRRIGSSDDRAIGSSKTTAPIFDHPMTRSPDEPISFRWPDGEQFLAILDGLAVSDKFLDQFSRRVALDFVHQLHRFNNAQNLAHFQPIADFDEGWRSGRRRFVEGAHDRRLHNVQPFLNSWRNRAR